MSQNREWFVGLTWQANVEAGANRPAEEAEVFSKDSAEIWTPDNPSGWTYQEVEAGFDRVLRFDDEASAEIFAELERVASKKWWAERAE